MLKAILKIDKYTSSQWQHWTMQKPCLLKGLALPSTARIPTTSVCIYKRENMHILYSIDAPTWLCNQHIQLCFDDFSFINLPRSSCQHLPVSTCLYWCCVDKDMHVYETHRCLHSISDIKNTIRCARPTVVWAFHEKSVFWKLFEWMLVKAWYTHVSLTFQKKIQLGKVLNMLIYQPFSLIYPSTFLPLSFSIRWCSGEGSSLFPSWHHQPQTFISPNTFSREFLCWLQAGTAQTTPYRRRSCTWILESVDSGEPKISCHCI